MATRARGSRRRRSRPPDERPHGAAGPARDPVLRAAPRAGSASPAEACVHRWAAPPRAPPMGRFRRPPARHRHDPSSLRPGLRGWPDDRNRLHASRSGRGAGAHPDSGRRADMRRTTLQRAPLVARPPELYDACTAADVMEEIRGLARSLRGLRVVQVNSTASGGCCCWPRAPSLGARAGEQPSRVAPRKGRLERLFSQVGQNAPMDRPAATRPEVESRSRVGHRRNAGPSWVDPIMAASRDGDDGKAWQPCRDRPYEGW
jgi:hypothetical protein